MENPGSSNLPKFDPTDTSTVSNRWKKWKRCFEIFLDVNNVTAPARKRSYLLYYAGSDVQDIFFNLRGEAEVNIPAGSDVYAESIRLLDDYFLPLKCLPRERHIFRNLEQAPDESIEKFVLRLREQGNLCDYANWLDENIKEQLFEKGNSDELRAKILTKPNMTLAQTVELGRSLETIAKHRKNLVKCEEVNRISSSKGECFRCGHSGHYANDDECPARDKRCEKCNLVGHFRRCCKTKRKELKEKKTARKGKNRHRSKVNQVASEDSGSEEGSDDSSSDEESVNYVFATSPDDDDRVACKVGGVKLNWMVDSGAGVNVISEETWSFLKKQKVEVEYQTKKVAKTLLAYGNHRLSVKGMFVAKIETKKSCVRDKVFVVKESGLNLLGRKAAKDLGILKIDTSICTIKKSDDTVGKVKGVTVSIQIDPDVKPVQHSQCRIPIPLQPKVENELRKLLEEDIIERAPRDSPWISRLVVRPKAGDEVRLCVDMRDANKAIVPQHHPLPTFDDIIPHLHNCKVFSKIDLNKAFHQIELSEDSRAITTFAAHDGYYRYKRLTFGMNCASEVFQSVIERVLAGIKNVKPFIDDILIFGASVEEHDVALAAVLNRLKEYGMTINAAKCQFRKDEVTFMGHQLTDRGINPSDDKVDAIRRFRNPETAEELRSFLGLINYLGKFIPNLSTMTAPLRELLKKDVKFKWEPRHSEAFEQIKREVSDPRNLGYYSPHDETILIADASPVGLGAVLLQVRDGKKRVICYISKGLSPAERSYAQNEREALALVWATERLEPYLRGLEFKLVTDHEPLKVIFGTKSKPCHRIERWALRLQSYRYTIVHVSGKANIADPLSRLPEFQKCSTYDQIGESMLLAILDTAKPTALTIDEILGKTVKDSELSSVKEALNTGQWSVVLKRYEPFRTELGCVNDILMRGTRIVIPSALRDRVLKLSHIGHPGIERTKQRLRGKVWWPQIDKDAERMVKSCLDCQLVSGTTGREPMSVRELPSEPWHTLAMDMLGPLPSNESILVVIDLYSRYRITEVMKTTTSDDIIAKLRKVFLRLGIPANLVSDNAKNFSSAKMEDFCKQLGIKLKHTTPYWPQANGDVERQNRSILKILRIAEINKSDWKIDLEEANYVYSMVQHPATGRSPAEVLFGRKFRDWIPQLTPSENVTDGETRDRDWIYKHAAKTYYDANNRTTSMELQPNDRVLMRNLVPQNKLSAMFHPEPVTVRSKAGNSVVVETAEGKQYRRNSSHLKKLPDCEEIEGSRVQDETSDAEWITPSSTTRISSSTPASVSGTSVQANGCGRPKREVKRPLRFEDYELN